MPYVLGDYDTMDMPDQIDPSYSFELALQYCPRCNSHHVEFKVGFGGIIALDNDVNGVYVCHDCGLVTTSTNLSFMNSLQHNDKQQRCSSCEVSEQHEEPDTGRLLYICNHPNRNYTHVRGDLCPLDS
jgi:hypothetical protein